MPDSSWAATAPQAPAPWRQSSLQPTQAAASALSPGPAIPRWPPTSGAGAALGVGGFGGLRRIGSSSGRVCMMDDDDNNNSTGDDDDVDLSDGRWELRRSVTDEELEAAISSCVSSTGSSAVLMEGIFTDVTFPKGWVCPWGWVGVGRAGPGQGGAWQGVLWCVLPAKAPMHALTQ